MGFLTSRVTDIDVRECTIPGEIAAPARRASASPKDGSDLAKAAAAVAKDITDWKPSNKLSDEDKKVKINTSPVDDWVVTQLDAFDANAILFQPQVLAPLSLKAIQDIFNLAITGKSSVLIGARNPAKGMVMVTKDFLQSKPNGIGPKSVKDDVLSLFSRVLSIGVIDGQIGGLKDALEYVVNTPRAVPLLEFRALASKGPVDMEVFNQSVDATIADYHTSCGYTVLSTNTVANPITIETQTYTAGCSACTLVGGIADTPKCTSISGCTTTSTAPSATFTVFLSNDTVSIGDAENANDGSDLRKNAFDKIQALCPDKSDHCDSKQHAVIEHVPTIKGENEENGKEKLTFTQQAAKKSCKELDYVESSQNGCSPTGPVKRGLGALQLVERRDLLFNATELEKRHFWQTNEDKPQECHYKGTVCSAPNHITPMKASGSDPYANHLSIAVVEQLEEGISAFDEFICEAIIDGLSELAMLVAPELAPADVGLELEFQTLCRDAVSAITGD
ncbi:uncharacterized protein KY384_006725 [Bacidia gigantensis]|uniref:uncharacterized protein n=1 Tax=Bacidia gigantensis TaxID=2732470 RepID=UPI001D039A7E|nr:uncharacterized protein KY384_006725 [Bacidia gigantensis]KAG8528553.1 hypothetical protein KY384_006725 [Bacidia gigantensis]